MAPASPVSQSPPPHACVAVNLDTRLTSPNFHLLRDIVCVCDCVCVAVMSTSTPTNSRAHAVSETFRSTVPPAGFGDRCRSRSTASSAPYCMIPGLFLESLGSFRARRYTYECRDRAFCAFLLAASGWCEFLVCPVRWLQSLERQKASVFFFTYHSAGLPSLGISMDISYVHIGGVGFCLVKPSCFREI